VRRDSTAADSGNERSIGHQAIDSAENGRP
jgi:hypothetical protein